MRGELLDRDPAYALDVLRTSERRDDHDGVLRACEALVAVAAWQPVWELSGRLLDRAWCRGIMVFIHDASPAGGRYECVAGHHRCGYVVQPEPGEPTWPGEPFDPDKEHHGDHRLARLAANCVRLLTPVPQAYPEHAAARWMAQSDARDVLARYVGALRLWWPEGWWNWLWLRGNTLRRQDPSLAFDGVPGAIVHADGRVECGTVCPPLPPVPAREEVDRG